MKKLNKKGFILVETLIVTVFVVTLFLLVFKVTVPSIGEYEQEILYDDIDSIYYGTLYKEMVTRYGKFDYIDSHLSNNTYIDISDCNDTRIYSNVKYCQLVKESIGATDGKIFLTDYNIKRFKQEVKNNEFFDSGVLSNFRDYLNTISNHETFYNNLVNSTDLRGKYRLFIVRKVKDADNAVTRRFSNLGLYTGTNSKYLMGEKVIYNPGDGNKEFFVLANSNTTDQYVTLILADNLPNSSVCFNSERKSTIKPTTVLDKLSALTTSWNNVPTLTGYTYTSTNGYQINYNGYRARLLEKNDILNLLGCKEDEKTCFDVDEAFDVEFDKTKLSFLINNLTDTNGYWTADTIKNSDWAGSDTPGAANYIPGAENYNYAYAWSIKNGTVAAVGMNDCTNYGIRPVIKVEKDNVIRGQ